MTDKIVIGKVHGTTTIYKIINDIPHFPEPGKKGKIKWQATVVCPQRLATFEEFEGTEEEAMEKVTF